MISASPHILLEKWRRRHLWVFSSLCAIFLLSIILLIQFQLLNSYVGLLLGVVGVGLLHLINRKGRPMMDDVLELVHIQNPALQYSAQLLLEGTETNGLASIQQKRSRTVFGNHNYRLPWNNNFLRTSLFIILGSVSAGICIQYVINHSGLNASKHQNIDYVDNLLTLESVVTELDSTYLKSIRITVTPPEYTNRSARMVEKKTLEILEGSQVKWQPTIRGPFNKFYFNFSEGDTVELKSPLVLQKAFYSSDYYQYGFQSDESNYNSDFYGIKVIPDAQPEITISGIEEYVRLPWGKNHEINFNITLSDDYQLSEAFIVATIAKGTGESVKFRERKFDLNNFYPGNSKHQSVFTFETGELEMDPGDELYFYIRTDDNYPYGEHWVKSTTHFISIQDTVTYEYVEDGGMQVDLMPDFFRSQRQIIIDSEKLIASKPNISLDSFKRASNNLGFDQKMLRLKYGQFLGEENESGISFNNSIVMEEEEHNHDHDHDHEHEEDHSGASATLENARDLLNQFMHDHDHEEEEGQLLATKGTESSKNKDPARPSWVEELSHNHDDAETATFHDVSVKSKLKAALSTMWDAELHLRLYDPSTSLPFQNNSLKLLQEIKNHARIYVHRIGFEPPAIKEGELRLNGDQDKIDNRETLSSVEIDQEYEALKIIVGILENRNRAELTDALNHTIKSLAKISLERPEVLPVLTMANNLNQDLDQATNADLMKLRTHLISVIPNEAEAINSGIKNAHELTLSVAQKLAY